MTRTAHLARRPVRYLEAGHGRPLVWIHAFPLSADQWLPQLGRVPAGWRFLAPDLHGFRGAGPAWECVGLESQTIDGYADDILELLTHLDVPAADIGGLSMGGYVALAIVHRAPERVSGLVLANTRAGSDSPDGKVQRGAMLDLIAREGADGLARGMVPKLLGETTRREQPDLADAVTRLITLNGSDGLAGGMRAMRDRPDSTPILKHITCPALIIHGAEDAIIPVSEAESMHAAIPGWRLVVLPRVGHLANLEDPAGFNAAIAAR
ncbi:MAG TPA: alpha/beta hydrolase [Vicinamibacterales bacterium]|nr:alpha/beta hydrolase [Vicinamibacterales bacterium]